MPICAAPERPDAAPAISGRTLIAPEMALGSERPLAMPGQHHRHEKRRRAEEPGQVDQRRQRGGDEGERIAGEDHAGDAEALGEAAGQEIAEGVADRDEANHRP